MMTAVTSKMNRMVLLYMLILSMVSLPTILPKHLLVETADKGGDDYQDGGWVTGIPPTSSPWQPGQGTIDWKRGRDYQCCGNGPWAGDYGGPWGPGGGPLG